MSLNKVPQISVCVWIDLSIHPGSSTQYALQRSPNYPQYFALGVHLNLHTMVLCAGIYRTGVGVGGGSLGLLQAWWTPLLSAFIGQTCEVQFALRDTILQ